MKMTSLLKVKEISKIEPVVKRKERYLWNLLQHSWIEHRQKKTLSKALSSLVLFLLGQVFEVRHQLFCGDKSQHQVVSWAWLSEGCQIARCWGDDDDDNVDGDGDGDGDGDVIWPGHQGEMVRSKGETWEGATALQELLREQVILILTLIYENLNLGYIIFWGGGKSSFGQFCTTMQKYTKAQKYR